MTKADTAQCTRINRPKGILTATLLLALALPGPFATPANAAATLVSGGASSGSGPGSGPSPAQAATMEGTWSTRARVRDDGRERIQLSLEVDQAGRSGPWHTGFGVDPGQLEGLSFVQASGTVREARFRMVREAGTVTFEGAVTDGRGAGTFAFIPSAGWIRDMGDLGYAGLSEDQVFSAAVHDITTAYVRELGQLGYADLPENDLFKFAIHGVTAEFIREMNGLGYRDVPAGKLVTLRIHGVSPEWVREVRRAMGG